MRTNQIVIGLLLAAGVSAETAIDNSVDEVLKTTDGAQIDQSQVGGESDKKTTGDNWESASDSDSEKTVGSEAGDAEI